MKKYKLLKELPGLGVGTILVKDGIFREYKKINGKKYFENVGTELNQFLNYLEGNNNWLEEIKEPKSIYELEEGDEYYSIFYDDIYRIGFHKMGGPFKRYEKDLEIGNVFLTKQEAEKELEKRKALAKIKKWIWENKIELTNKNDFGYTIKYKVNEGIIIDNIRNDTYSFCDIIFEKVEDAEKCLEECKEQWNILFDLDNYEI